MRAWLARLSATAAGLVAAVGAAETLLRTAGTIFAGSPEERRGSRLALGLLCVVVGAGLLVAGLAVGAADDTPSIAPPAPPEVA